MIVLLQRLGIAFFTFHLLTVRGRRSGTPQTTPVSPFRVDGRSHVMSFGQTDWVKNARAAGAGVLSRGRRQQPVTLVELPSEESAAIAREFPVQVPYGVDFYVRLGVDSPPGDATPSRPLPPAWRCSASKRRSCRRADTVGADDPRR